MIHYKYKPIKTKKNNIIIFVILLLVAISRSIALPVDSAYVFTFDRATSMPVSRNDVFTVAPRKGWEEVITDSSAHETIKKIILHATGILTFVKNRLKKNEYFLSFSDGSLYTVFLDTADKNSWHTMHAKIHGTPLAATWHNSHLTVLAANAQTKKTLLFTFKEKDDALNLTKEIRTPFDARHSISLQSTFNDVFLHVDDSVYLLKNGNFVLYENNVCSFILDDRKNFSLKQAMYAGENGCSKNARSYFHNAHNMINDVSIHAKNFSIPLLPFFSNKIIALPVNISTMLLQDTIDNPKLLFYNYYNILYEIHVQ